MAGVKGSTTGLTTGMGVGAVASTAGRGGDIACIITAGTQVRGNVSGGGNIVIEGRLEGNVSLQDQMHIAQQGVVVADIDVRELIVDGRMSGQMNASDRITLTSNAMASGDIRAPQVVIEEGARFSGQIEMDVPLPDDI